MRITLRFPGQAEASIQLSAETDAERAILAFLAEGGEKRWIASPAYSYRAGGIADLTLVVEQPFWLFIKGYSRDV